MFLTPEQTAIKIGVAASTLAKWRLAGADLALPFIKVGRSVRYSDDAVNEWLASRSRFSTSQGAR